MDGQQWLVSPDGEIRVLAQILLGNVLADQLVVIADVYNALVTVIGAYVLNLIGRVLFAADQTFKMDNVNQFLHGYSFILHHLKSETPSNLQEKVQTSKMLDV